MQMFLLLCHAKRVLGSQLGQTLFSTIYVGLSKQFVVTTKTTATPPLSDFAV